jgi:hypothetical protein
LQKRFFLGIDELYRNPIHFIFKILRSEVEEVEENIVEYVYIHETLKRRTFHRKFISERDLENCFKQIDAEVLKQFKVVYKKERLRKVEIYSLLKWLNAMYLISKELG